MKFLQLNLLTFVLLLLSSSAQLSFAQEDLSYETRPIQVVREGVDETGDPKLEPIVITITDEQQKPLKPWEKAALQEVIDGIAAELFIRQNANLREAQPSTSFRESDGPLINRGDIDRAGQGQPDSGLQEPGSPLTEAQFKQILNEARLEARMDGGQKVAWEVNSVLMKGEKQIRIDMRRSRQQAHWIFTVSLPDSFMQRTRPNLKEGAISIYKALKELTSIAVGIPATNPRYSSVEIDDQLDAAAQQAGVLNVETQAPNNEVDLRLEIPEFAAAVGPVVEKIIQRETRDWERKTADETRDALHAVLRTISVEQLVELNELARSAAFNAGDSDFDFELPSGQAQGEGSLSAEQIEKALSDVMSNIRQARIYKALRESKELDSMEIVVGKGTPEEETVSSEGIARRIIQMTEAKRIILAAHTEFYLARSIKYESILNDLEEEYPNRLPRKGLEREWSFERWFQREARKRLHQWYAEQAPTHFQNAQNKLMAAGLQQDALMFAGSLEYYNAELKADQGELESKVVEARRFKWSFPLWPRHWKIKKNKEGKHYAEKTDSNEVSSDSWFWSVQNVFKRGRSISSGGLWALWDRAVINGPMFLGWKAMLSPGKFSAKKYVDPKTGKILAEGKVWDDAQNKAVWEGAEVHPVTGERAEEDFWWVKADQGKGSYFDEHGYRIAIDPRKNSFLTRTKSNFRTIKKWVDQDSAIFNKAVVKFAKTITLYPLGAGFTVAHAGFQLAATAALGGLSAVLSVPLATERYLPLISGTIGLGNLVLHNEDDPRAGNETPNYLSQFVAAGIIGTAAGLGWGASHILPWLAEVHNMWTSIGVGVVAFIAGESIRMITKSSRWFTPINLAVAAGLGLASGYAAEFLGGFTPASIWIVTSILSFLAIDAVTGGLQNSDEAKRRFPWLKQLGYQAGVMGVGEMGLWAGKILFWDLLRAAGWHYAVVHTWNGGVRRLTDRFSYHFLLNPFPPLSKIFKSPGTLPEPGVEYKFLFLTLLYQVEGRDKSRQYFGRLNRAEKALFVVKARTEAQSLRIFESRVRKILIESPRSEFEKVKADLQRELAAMREAGIEIASYISEAIGEQEGINSTQIFELVGKTYEMLESISQVNRRQFNSVKLDAKDLATVMAGAKELVEANIRPQLLLLSPEERKAYWTRFNKVGDSPETENTHSLIQTLLAEAFGEEINSAFETTDQTHEVEVEPGDLLDVISGKPDRVSVLNSRWGWPRPQSAQPELPVISHGLCDTHLLTLSGHRDFGAAPNY